MVTAGRPSSRRELDVWMNGLAVGRWSFAPAYGHSFEYAQSWLAAREARPLSLSLPLPASAGARPHRGDVVRSYFDNLLPDSEPIRRRLQGRFRAVSTEAFDLLAEIGRDCVGAVQLLPADSDASNVQRIDAEPLTSGQVARVLDAVIHGGELRGDDDGASLRISLAGAQEKTALLWHEGQWCRPLNATPTTHLFKLPLGRVGARRADFSTSVENEWLCAQILKAYGLPVAECRIERIEQHKVLVVERFDRKLIGGRWWARLPQEDLCQATGTPPELKYEADGGPGIDRILDVLRGSDYAAVDRERFLAIQVLFWMLAAPDGHAKNFSLFLRPQGSFVMTQLYDVMSAWPIEGSGASQVSWHKLKLAMAVRGKSAHYRLRDIRRRHWVEIARRRAVGAHFGSVIAGIAGWTERVIETVRAVLPKGFPAKVSDPIFEGLRRSARMLMQESE